MIVQSCVALVFTLFFGFTASDAAQGPQEGFDAAVKVHDKVFIPFISKQKIQQRVKTLGEQIAEDYKDKKPLMICVLKGAVVFFVDLVRSIRSNIEMDFITLSSYGNAMRSSGTIKIPQGLSSSVADRDIIIVEDIIDSGKTITFLRNFILEKKPRSLRIATLLKKPDATLDEPLVFKIDYVGFEIPSDFVVGYGLDYAQQGRNLDAIYKHITAKL